MKSLYRAALMSLLAILALVLITVFNVGRFGVCYSYDKVIEELEDSGFVIEIEDVSKDILQGERKWLTIDQQDNLSIYIYPTATAMEEDAECVTMNGCSYRSSMKQVFISWSSFPHFYKMKNIIVLYVGENQRILDTLEEICGMQFAGYNP